jgi:glycolate oxidase
MDAVEQLRAALADVVTDPDILATYRHDEADLCAAGTPLAVVRPHDTAGVVAAVEIASAHRIPVVPQGARTGLAGAANAVDGAIVVSLTGMNRIVDLDPAERIAVVQPGVVNADLRRAAAASGLHYPPDPASWESSTIGGNVSTDAGGMCCVKYGVTSRYVLGLEVVLASGEVLRCGRRTAKGVAGYDLTSLFVGAEGTLGIITEITVRLNPAPAEPLTMVAVFPKLAAAGAAVSAVAAAGLTPSLLELLDQAVLRAIEEYRPMGLNTDAEAVLLAASDSGAADLQRIAALCARSGADEVYTASDTAEGEALLAARRLAHPALEQLAARTYPGGTGVVIIDDVAVPRSRLVELIEGVQRISALHDLPVPVVGHAGDGNLHPNILVDRTDPDSVARGRVVFDEIMKLGLDLGGTCTGEHGVGLLKRDWLASEVGPVGIRVHQAIKSALDPAGILNPGKVF